MPSTAFQTWSANRAADLDEIENAFGAAGFLHEGDEAGGDGGSVG